MAKERPGRRGADWAVGTGRAARGARKRDTRQAAPAGRTTERAALMGRCGTTQATRAAQCGTAQCTEQATLARTGQTEEAGRSCIRGICETERGKTRREDDAESPASTHKVHQRGCSIGVSQPCARVMRTCPKAHDAQRPSAINRHKYSHTATLAIKSISQQAFYHLMSPRSHAESLLDAPNASFDALRCLREVAR